MIQYFLICIKAYFPITALCSKCGIETTFGGIMWIRTKKRRHRFYQYQCQHCGKLKYSGNHNDNSNVVALSERCKCQGQYRRDKNIFCPNCHHRKTEYNKDEDYNTLTDNEIEILTKRHGNEYI